MSDDLTQQPGWWGVREQRLDSDRRKLKELTRISSLISITEEIGTPLPEKYRVRFTCRGIARIDGHKPVYSELHEVSIDLPQTYPARPPRMRWMTPIFHPNISPTGTQVCIAKWYPAKFLDDLCIMLGRMIQYKNYNPGSCLNRTAAGWIKNHSNLAPVDLRPLRQGEVPDRGRDDFEIRVL